MCELKKNGKVLTNKSVGTGPSSYEKGIYMTAVSQRLRNTVLGDLKLRCRPRCTVRAFNTYQCDVELNSALFTLSDPMSRFNGNVISQRLVVASLKLLIFMGCYF